jgi:hypothetical protein
LLAKPDLAIIRKTGRVGAYQCAGNMLGNFASERNREWGKRLYDEGDQKSTALSCVDERRLYVESPRITTDTL